MKPLSQKQVSLMTEAFQLGQRAIQLRAFAQAEKCFLDVLKINPNAVEAQTSLAFTYAASNQHAKACTRLKEVLKAHPAHAHTHHNLANSLYELGLYDEAIQHYQTALKIDPNLVDSNIHCGVAYRKLKNYEAAITYLRRALDLDKANARAFHILGVIFAETEDYNRALDCLKSATELAPKHVEYRLCFASTLEKASLDYEAELQYHLTCENGPDYIDGFTLYGKFLFKNRFYDEALECFKRAEQLAPQNPDVLYRVGQTYLGMGNTDAALEKYCAVLQKDPHCVFTLTSMGQAYQEAGRVDAAIEIADKIIAIDNSLPNGYLLQASVRNSKPDDGLAENLLKIADKPDLQEQDKININFVLGKIFNDHKNYVEAFKYYANGNSLKNKILTYSKVADEAQFTKLIEIFTSDLFNSHVHLGIESNLPVLIVGMPRSGTTLTEQIISSHPDVIGAGEVVFWNGSPKSIPLRLGTKSPYPECIREMTPKQANDIAKMYETTLQKIVGPNTRPTHITDKMPHNFLYVGLIALLFPNVKIIHTKRDPIDTCLSIFFQNFNDSHLYGFDLGNLGFHYKQYERIMRHWHEVLPGRIMDIQYENTIADPEYWSRKLIDHIGLKWDDACLAPHKLERAVKTASHWQVRQPIYKTSVQRWKNYEQFLGPLIEALKD